MVCISVLCCGTAVDALQFTQLSQALTNIWLWIPNLIAFIVILVIGSIIADFAGNWVQRELPARGITGGKVIGMAAKGILYTIVFVTAITQLQIGAGILNTVISALVWGIVVCCGGRIRSRSSIWFERSNTFND